MIVRSVLLRVLECCYCIAKLEDVLNIIRDIESIFIDILYFYFAFHT